MIKTGICVLALSFCMLLTAFLTLPASERADFDNYRGRLNNVENIEDIDPNGFVVLEDQSFQTEFDNLGTVNVIPSFDPKYGRLILFFADESGRVLYKTDELECNSLRRGELNQTNIGATVLAFRDINHDGLRDIVLISWCNSRDSSDTGITHKVGDVLFQCKTGFYRDHRLSDRINRFSMNTDLETIIVFARDGISAEFLYLAETLDQLTENGFQPIGSRNVAFERFGQSRMVYGTYRMAGYYIFMIYLTDSDGNILWNFQTMGNYSNFNAVREYSFRDIDEDGMADVIFLIRFDTQTMAGETVRITDYFIYYQRAGYFEEDTEIKKMYACTEDDTIANIAERIKDSVKESGY